MVQNLSRKSFVNVLGVAGLGVGLLASMAGAPSAAAQEEDPQDVLVQLLQDAENDPALQDEDLKKVLIKLMQDEEGVIALAGDEPVKDVVFERLQDDEGGFVVSSPAPFEEKQSELYAEFTAALADELGIGDADEVDAAIRIAMMSVIDARVDEGILTAGKAEALKFLIATSDVPLPSMGLGVGPGRMFIAAHGPGFGPGADHIRGAIHERIFDEESDARDDEKKERAARADRESDKSDSQSDEDDQG